MSQMWTSTLGAARFEFNMQIRRKSVWIAMAATILFMFAWSRSLWAFPVDSSMPRTVGNWALDCNRFLPVVFGILVADRLPRDRRLRMTELLDATPAPAGSLLFGKYVGGTLATAVPIFLFYIVGLWRIQMRTLDPMVIPTALAVFAAVILPGLIFVAAFSIAIPAILWVPLYQFLFVGYWFWGNMFAPAYGIPTLANTILTPIGGTAASGFFGTYPMFDHPLTSGIPMAWQAVMSVSLLMICAVAALLAVHTYLTWQRARA